MSLISLLATLSQDELRELSDWRLHYPVEQTTYDDADHETHLIVCGCEERFGYPWGSGIHT